MSNSKKKSKKRRLSDTDSLPILPNSKRQKISHSSHPSSCGTRVTMEQDVEVRTSAATTANHNNTNHFIKKKNATANHNHKHHNHNTINANSECKQASPEPPLLFINDHSRSHHMNSDSNNRNENHFAINMDKRVSTPMGFNLSDNEIIAMVLEYLEAAGYGKSVECLSKESGIEYMRHALDEQYIKQWALNGDWNKLMQFYHSFEVNDTSSYLQSHRCSAYITATNLFYSKILIIEQKFFELIHQNAKLLATKVLNDELIPLISPSTDAAKVNTNIQNDIESDQNMADIELISSLIHNNKRSHSHRSRHHHYDIEMDSLYPRRRWNKVCSLLFVDTNAYDGALQSELDALNDLKRARHKLYNELECKLVPSNNNDNLLSIFDEFVKCQLFERQHFNLRSNNVSLSNVTDDIGIPSHTYYILKGHRDEITHLSFDCAGEWLISSANDKRTLIWDFSDILMSEPRLNGDIRIICDILHYFPVTSHALSPNREYLITISEYQANFDDFKHNKDRRRHIERESDCNWNNGDNNNNLKRQFKWEHFDESHRTYFDAKKNLNINANEQPLMMETERGCNIYVWKLNENGGDNSEIGVTLYRQYHHYRVSASVCWCPDSAHYFITSFGSDIDLYSVESGEMISALPSNGNLMSDLRLTHSGYRLCVTLNGRDIRIYNTDFSVYYKLLKEYLKRAQLQSDNTQPVPCFVPWLHFSDTNHVNLFENNISNYITKCLSARNNNNNDATYNNLSHIAAASDACNNDIEWSSSDEASSADDNDNKSVASLDDKLWIFYEEKLDLDKKTHGQLHNDCIVSSAVSCGEEYEYLLLLVHQFNINLNPMPHPIILMIDLRSISQNIENEFNIKFFYGFKQNRFKLQCGFGGYSLPPISNESRVYRQSKYEKMKMKKKINTQLTRAYAYEEDNSEAINVRCQMIGEMVEICLKFPSFLPTQMQLLDNDNRKENKKRILRLFVSLPFAVLCKLYKFMKNESDIVVAIDADHTIEMMDIRRQLLEFEVCAHQAANRKEYEFKREDVCCKLKREKEYKSRSQLQDINIESMEYDDDNMNYIWRRMDEVIEDHHLAMEIKYFIYQKFKRKEKAMMNSKEKEKENEIINNNNLKINRNCSVNELNINETKQISNLMDDESESNKNVKSNNSLIHSEYIENDYFGGHHFIISGSEDGNVCIWNRCTQKIIKLSGHKKSVNCVVWNPTDSFILVSGGDDSQIRVWGPKQKKL